MRASRTRRPRSLPTARLLALAVLLLAAACGRQAPPEPPAEAAEPAAPLSGGTAVVAAASDISGLNPLLHGGESFAENLFGALFLRLFEEQPDFAEGPPTFAPELAVAWQWSADERTLTVELRPDVMWSDGAPLTTADVVWTWRQQTDPRIAWDYAGQKDAIVDMTALDDRRLRVEFASPAANRLAELNQGHILPSHRWRKLPVERWRDSAGWFRDNLVVSGPFLLTDWQPDQQIVLERNPSYFRAGYPRLDRVVFRIVPEPNNRLAQLLAGAVDFVAQVPAADARRIAEGPGTRLETLPARQYNFLHWNLRRPLLAEVAARQALTLAIDRQTIIDTLWHGYASIAGSPIVSSVWAHRADPGPWPYDPARAAELLAALGWRDADGDGMLERRGRSCGFELLTNADSQVRSDAAVMIQEDLRRIGVEVRIRRLEWNAVVERMRGGDFDAVLSGFKIDTSLDLAYAFHSGSVEGRYNFGGYANPEVDRLIEAARVSRDTAERRRLLYQIQGILHDEQPFTLLWEPLQLNGVSRRLRGVLPNPLSPLFRIEQWWLAPAA